VLTVLVVSGGGFQGLGILSALRALGGVRAVVVDVHADSPGRYVADAFHSVPPVAAGSAFLEALLQIAGLESARLVIPSTSFELDELARAAPDFHRRGVAVAVSSPALLHLCADKRRLYAALAENGLPVLPLVDPREREAPFPLVGKPASGWGSRGVVVVGSAAERDREWSTRMAEEYVWQRRVHPARELSVDFAIDFEGRVSEPGVRLRVRTSGGFATVTDSARSDDAVRWTKRFAALAAGLGGCGAFNLQFLEDAGGLYLSDVNPRFGTSAVHWRGTDRDPIFHLCRSVDGSVSASAPAAPMRTVRVLGQISVEADALPAESSLRAVVFDLDDTLLPQKRWILSKLEALWESDGDGLPERQAFLAEALRIVEEGPRGLLFDELAARFAWPPARKDRLIDAYRAIVPASCALYPDALPALASLRVKGYRLGLLTDNPPASQRQKLEVAGLAPWFDAIVFSREAGGEKPDPAAFGAMAGALGEDPSALAMVGDNPYRDGLAAVSAGYGAAYVVARAGSFHNFDRVLSARLPGSARLRFLASLSELAVRLPGLPREGTGPARG
jgi:FMN phosphatase YigB (HAD superfamily)